MEKGEGRGEEEKGRREKRGGMRGRGRNKGDLKWQIGRARGGKWWEERRQKKIYLTRR